MIYKRCRPVQPTDRRQDICWFCFLDVTLGDSQDQVSARCQRSGAGPAAAFLPPPAAVVVAQVVVAAEAVVVVVVVVVVAVVV